jgi:anaerobic selenocysteine-containing dehydrogenase
MEIRIHGQSEQFVLINAVDADQRGIKHGGKIKVFNGRGAFCRRCPSSMMVKPVLNGAMLGYRPIKRRYGGEQHHLG